MIDTAALFIYQHLGQIAGYFITAFLMLGVWRFVR